MKKIVSSIIVSLDGKVAAKNGDLRVFKVEEEFFNMSHELTEAADVALYGKGTYHIMQSYWPTAGDAPDASKHDKEHSAWYKRVPKFVVSTTIKSEEAPNTTIISKNVAEEITKLKQGIGKNIQIFGSPGLVRSLTELKLIDEYWMFLFPTIVGDGMPLFKDTKHAANFKLLEARTLKSGAVALHYETIKN